MQQWVLLMFADNPEQFLLVQSKLISAGKPKHQAQLPVLPGFKNLPGSPDKHLKLSAGFHRIDAFPILLSYQLQNPAFLLVHP